MGRTRDPKRDEAFEVYKASGGTINLNVIAAQLEIGDGTLRGWKAKDKWDLKLSETENGTLHTKKKNVLNDSERSNDIPEERNKKISWTAIENEYVTDIRKKPFTLEVMAKKYGISFGYMMQYAAEHNWTDKRRNNLEMTKKKTAQKTTDILSDEISRTTARHIKISNKLLEIVEEAIESKDEFYKKVEKLRTGYGPGVFKDEIVVEVVESLNDAKLTNVVSAFEKLQKSQRLSLSIMDEKDKRKIELEERKAAGEGDLDEDLINDWAGAVMIDGDK